MDKIKINALKSIIIGMVISIIVGFLFSTPKFFFNNVEISEKVYNLNKNNEDVFNQIIIKEEFNYKAGLIIGALVLLFFMFVIYDDKTNRYFHRKGIIFFDNFTKLLKNKFSLNSKVEVKKNLLYFFNNKIFNFNGRYSRINYLWRLSLISFCMFNLFEEYQKERGLDLFSFILLLTVFLYYLVKIKVKRLQDFNISGWYSIIGISPLLLICLATIVKWDFLRGLVLVGWNIIFGIIIIFNLILLLVPGNFDDNAYKKKSN
jgi:uncharacterized membrane protein YhaH (DUF805 family)